MKIGNIDKFLLTRVERYFAEISGSSIVSISKIVLENFEKGCKM